MKKKTKLFMAIIIGFSLVSCSANQMAITGLALAGTMAAGGAYYWLSHPDAQTAVGQNPKLVVDAVKKTLNKNDYYITSTNQDGPKTEIDATISSSNVEVVVEALSNSESKIYIKDHRGSDQATILLNQIIKNI